MTRTDQGRLEGADALAWTSAEKSTAGPCVFVDRDGVINERADGGFVLDWAQFKWRPDALLALRTLADARVPIVVVSNQSCIGRGLLAPEKLVDIMARMVAALSRNGSPLHAWYCCPHAPDAGCDCRKPKPGMLRRAARESGFDLTKSHMIGDTDTDVAAGAAAGCATVKIDPEDPQAFAAAARSIAAFTR
jgi:D-glycero-D-manno-heptose 1,7-bisphosphate phosphatase